MKKMLAMILAAILALTAAICGAAADGEWADYTCQEQSFSTKIPTSGTTVYDDSAKGIMIYTDVPGYIPYVIVSRRPADKKFSNPENYLNNVYREYIEEKFGDNNLGMNSASIWEIGGKELLGARYMYKIGDYTVIQLQLIEVRDAGDVEYTAKFIEGEDEATMAALNEAVRNYQETDAASQAPEQPAETETAEASAPPFMIPSYFYQRFNTMMETLAEHYKDALGEEGVKIMKEEYILTGTKTDGTTLDYVNPYSDITARFFYPDEASVSEETPAMMMSLIIKNEVPEDVVNYFVLYIFKTMIAYDFQDDVSLDELSEWFDTAEDPNNIFSIPGYTLNVIKTDDMMLYAVMPPASEIPQLQDTQE